MLPWPVPRWFSQAMCPLAGWASSGVWERNVQPPSLRGALATKQSSLIAEPLDCFAEPVIGRRFAPTRWLAMTLRHEHPRRRRQRQQAAEGDEDFPDRRGLVPGGVVGADSRRRCL